MLYIDGSHGEGGGQILRTALALAMVTGTDIKIENIRAGRSKRGLMRQHLACVKAAQKVCGAQVSGAKVGSTSIMFRPEAIQAGEYEFAVGTAGSTTLIFQTVLPALVLANGVSHLRMHGGTHNMMAPSYDFIALAFVPTLKRMGIEVSVELQRYGFYPQGGGEWSATITPATHFTPLQLTHRGKLVSKEAVITSANVPGHIALREMQEIARLCNWTEQEMQSRTVPAMGGGNIVSLRLHYQHCTEVVEEVGRIGLSAERVARNAVTNMRRYLAHDVAIGEHLADQLLLPMAIGEGGVFRTLRPSRHCKTNRDVIQMFTDKRISFEELGKDLWEIRM